jgi:hypothetical protein
VDQNSLVLTWIAAQFAVKNDQPLADESGGVGGIAGSIGRPVRFIAESSRAAA